jgi:hypothetical protein
MKRWIPLLAALFLIVFEAVPEGLALRGYHTIAGIIEFIYLAVITFSIYAWITGEIKIPWKHTAPFLYILLGYVLLRFALFDIIHNMSAGIPIFFIGTTKWYDQIWQWFFSWTHFPAVHFLWLTKLIAMLIGGTFLMKK